MLASRRLVAALVCALAAPSLALSPTAAADPTPTLSSSSTNSVGPIGTDAAAQDSLTGTKADSSASLQQCITAFAQSERSATFTGEMKTIPGAARMQISIALLERTPEEQQYHTVTAPGLGGWQGSAPGVKVYTRIQQVTNLSAPALYRGAVRFRWLNGKGHVLKLEELRTPRCEQPVEPSTPSAKETSAAQSITG